MNLYWVTTNEGSENWFITAISQIEAERFHEEEDGFEQGEARAKLTSKISANIVKKHKVGKHPSWPSHELLKELGARIFSKHNPRKVNFNGILYIEGMNRVEFMFYQEFGHHNGVYVVKTQSTSNYKIGFTTNLLNRMKKFRTANPENIKLVYYIATDEYRVVERYLQNELAMYRMSGEWFQLLEQGETDLHDLLRKLESSEGLKCKIYDLVSVQKQAGSF